MLTKLKYSVNDLTNKPVAILKAQINILCCGIRLKEDSQCIICWLIFCNPPFIAQFY